ncbi:TolC family protein [Nitrosomonas oligotropha]|uniref:Outer membrane protein, cobalt-zinc-cadmium efflux system n=1 Tax=Nitrosomonas oligotropha TaxID=42354 RepID=A0A1H8S8I2_9PROT|nr:TolC family protein [Nitrosomonas oligotropha]SDX09604.1 outer membrane protein, cobalt-zinc-cadmium efflux system [Nitrosomonas oligotropha]SEO74483.1 outer membrane protein, cobalt-zinc-cadmium efflux system [Nitrosomonas oligotropha]
MQISPSFYLVLSIFLAISPLPALGQSKAKLTIEEIQRIGLEANGLVQAARSQVNIAKAGVVAASAFLNPEVTVTAGPDSNRYSLAITGPTSMQRSLTVNQPIENPYMRSARIDASEAGVDASRASLDQVRADLAAQLRVRAYELMLRLEQATIEQGIYDLLENLRNRIAANVERGEIARFELIRAETELQSAANRAQAAHLTAQRARVMLLQLTAGAIPIDFEISGSLKDPILLPPLTELREQVPKVNPEVVRLQAEQERASHRISQEKASVLPQISVLYTNYQDAQFTSNIAGASVRIPIWYRRRGEIDTAIYDSARIRETLEFRRYEISQLFEAAWQALQIAQRRVDLFEGGLIKEAENVVQVAQTAYRFGERGLIEFLDSQRILRGILSDSMQARFELQTAAAEIDRIRAHYPKELVSE